MTSELPTGDSRRVLLKAAAILLGYPGEGLDSLLDEMRPDVERSDEPAAAQLLAAIVALRALPPDVREASYVATFDFNEAHALYLTAHELGDSRRRGQALLDLRAVLRAAGFEPPEGELPDHLPLLIEFVAAVPPDVDTTPLERRLAAVCAQVHAALVEEDPYWPVLAALCALLPAAEPENAHVETGSAPRRPSRRPRFPLHERADTAELPYPLRYEE
ncbi:MAG TPA: nitrate reductase molybdenum cofactor assembly chaperone [Ktedonobacterales bacterium]